MNFAFLNEFERKFVITQMVAQMFRLSEIYRRIPIRGVFIEPDIEMEFYPIEFSCV